MGRLATAGPCLFSAAPPINNMQMGPNAKRLLKAKRPMQGSLRGNAPSVIKGHDCAALLHISPQKKPTEWSAILWR